MLNAFKLETLQLVKVPKIGEALCWLYNGVVNIQIAVGLLSRPDHFDELFDGRIDI